MSTDQEGSNLPSTSFLPLVTSSEKNEDSYNITEQARFTVERRLACSENDERVFQEELKIVEEANLAALQEVKERVCENPINLGDYMAKYLIENREDLVDTVLDQFRLTNTTSTTIEFIETIICNHFIYPAIKDEFKLLASENGINYYENFKREARLEDMLEYLDGSWHAVCSGTFNILRPASSFRWEAYKNLNISHVEPITLHDLCSKLFCLPAKTEHKVGFWFFKRFDKRGRFDQSEIDPAKTEEVELLIDNMIESLLPFLPKKLEKRHTIPPLPERLELPDFNQFNKLRKHIENYMLASAIRGEVIECLENVIFPKKDATRLHDDYRNNNFLIRLFKLPKLKDFPYHDEVPKIFETIKWAIAIFETGKEYKNTGLNEEQKKLGDILMQAAVNAIELVKLSAVDLNAYINVKEFELERLSENMITMSDITEGRGLQSILNMGEEVALRAAAQAELEEGGEEELKRFDSELAGGSPSPSVKLLTGTTVK